MRRYRSWARDLLIPFTCHLSDSTKVLHVLTVPIWASGTVQMHGRRKSDVENYISSSTSSRSRTAQVTISGSSANPKVSGKRAPAVAQEVAGDFCEVTQTNSCRRAANHSSVYHAHGSGRIHYRPHSTLSQGSYLATSVAVIVP